MTDGSTATDGPSMNRRTFIKGAGVATGVAATGTAGLSVEGGPTGEAQAIAPLIIGAAGAVGVGMIAGGLVEKHFLGGNDGQLDATGEDIDLYTELRTRLEEMDAANDSVLTTVSNRVEDSRNVAWPAAKKAVVNSFNNGEDEATATQAGKDAVNDYYTTIQKNLLNRFTEVTNQLVSIIDLANSNGDVAPKFVMTGSYGGTTNNGRSSFTGGDFTATLEDGSSFTAKRYLVPDGDYPNGSGLAYDPVNGVQDLGNLDSYTLLDVEPWDTGSILEPLDATRWTALWSDLTDAAQQMRDNVATYTTQLYQNYEVGELDPSDWMSASDLASEFSTDYETTGHHAYAAAEAAVAGIPGSSQQSMVIKLEDTGITVKGSIWSDWQPEAGSTSTATPTATDTNTTTTSTATASPGQSSSAFAVGTTYDPANTAKDVYLSYEYSGPEFIEGSDVFMKDDSGEWVQDGNVTSQSSYTDAYNSGSPLQVGFVTLEQSFTIQEAYDTATGDSVSTVSTESKNHQTASVSLTEEQMTQLTELRKELRESEQSGGGGGFDASEWSIFGIPGVGVIAGIASAGALALGVGKAAMEQ